MKVKNVHRRIIGQTKQEIWEQFEKLSSKEDKIWPYRQWPAIRFNHGLKVGSQGGHGPIRYTIIKKSFKDGVLFKFTGPKGFDGTHEFKILELEDSTVEVSHVINMATSGWDTYYWLFVVRWIHDALIEDAFDNLENLFSTAKKKTSYSIWVKCLRLIKPKKRNYYTKPNIVGER